MTPTEFNMYLVRFDQVMVFPEYMRRINVMTNNISHHIIEDYLFMYGKTKPCINGKKIYCYKSNMKPTDVSGLSRLIRKHGLNENTDFIVVNGEYMLSPKAYYKLIFASRDAKLISIFTKLFNYEDMYSIYLKMKKQ